MTSSPQETLAYLIGVAMGDGNLSNPNGRAVRLRITCDTKYPNLIKKISQAIESILPNNRVGIVHRNKAYIDISSYSNQWQLWLPWKVARGSKIQQSIRIPSWVKEDKKFSLACLRGLIETDGSVYNDRGYMMINFTTAIKLLAEDVKQLMENAGFAPKIYVIRTEHLPRYTLRLVHRAKDFAVAAKIDKS